VSSFFNKSFREILEISSSNSPTPGGGSVSAIVCCLGAAMTAMVANLTVGNDKYKPVEKEVQALLDTTTALINKLEALTDADMEAFDQLMAAYRLPKNTDEEKAARATTLQQALKNACNTPLETARVCLSVLKTTENLAPIGNKMAISDAGVAAAIAEAALTGVLLSVDINIPLIKDQAYVHQALNEKEALLAKAKESKDKTLAIVKERM